MCPHPIDNTQPNTKRFQIRLAPRPPQKAKEPVFRYATHSHFLMLFRARERFYFLHSALAFAVPRYTVAFHNATAPLHSKNKIFHLPHRTANSQPQSFSFRMVEVCTSLQKVV
jgi:hypothetical protein